MCHWWKNAFNTISKYGKCTQVCFQNENQLFCDFNFFKIAWTLFKIKQKNIKSTPYKEIVCFIVNEVWIFVSMKKILKLFFVCGKGLKIFLDVFLKEHLLFRQTHTEFHRYFIGSLKWTWTLPEHRSVNKENMTEGKSWTFFFHQNKQQDLL